MQGDILSIIENKPQNYLMNGDFAISQRFVSNVISPAVKYGVDRWFFANGTNCQRVAETGQAFKYALQTTATASGNTHVQRLESSWIQHLKNKTVTFSIKLKLQSGSLGGVPMLRIGYANAVDNFSTTTLVSDNNLESDAPIDGTYRLFKKSFLVTEQMAENGFYVQVGDFSSGTNVIRYAHAMLNEGAYAANFQLAGKNFIRELELCRRYFEKTYKLNEVLGTPATNASSLYNVSGSFTTGSTLTINWYWGSEKRIQPLVTLYSPLDGTVGSMVNGSGTNIVGGTIAATEKHCAIINSGVTNPNQSHYVHAVADAEL